ncbi:MAG TPA: post-transcriptional regulator [Bacillales bacterium]|nr:post-transcriptional regulator [Bacillales bacterium]
MTEAVTYEEWKDKLAPILKIKEEEFELLGYDGADKEEIWQCAVQRVNRISRKKPVRLHQFVNELLGLSVNDYMNRVRMDSLKGPDWFSGDEPLNLDEFDEPST